MSLGKRTPKTVLAEITLRWRRAGEARANFPPGAKTIWDVWMPRAPFRSGVYRITISLNRGRAVYIGESEWLNRRLYDYTRPYTEKRDTTEARLSRRIREALAQGRTVLVDTATTGKINLAGGDRALDMNKVAERRFAEAAAVLAESEQDVDGNTIVLNRILDEEWWLSD